MVFQCLTGRAARSAPPVERTTAMTMSDDISPKPTGTIMKETGDYEETDDYDS
jgi:hypothetical protein